MVKRVILAIRQHEYTAKLAQYLREEEPAWAVSAFTHEEALRRELQSNRVFDVLIAERGMLLELSEFSARIGKTIALVEDIGTGGGDLLQTLQYQPLPGLLAYIRSVLVGPVSLSPSGCRVLTVFSASGGLGKTTVALNLIRQAGERGFRTFYLNLETLNATALLFGKGEPDSLSRLLYSLQAHPEIWVEQFGSLCRHHPQLRTDFLDAPDHPGERLALTPELLGSLLEGLRTTGRYDLIIVDPDSGAGAWHIKLLDLSDQVVWLTVDDMQALAKAGQLLRYWQGQLNAKLEKVLFVLNRARQEAAARQWTLPGGSPAAILPYIPEWKAVDQLGRLLGSPAFSGAIELLSDHLNLAIRRPNGERRKEREDNGSNRAHLR
jgi:cellulose biosynthesis protein BcsQ